MEEKEWQDFLELIEQKMEELEELQRVHTRETGKRFVMPLRLGWPRRPWAVEGKGKT